MQLYSEVSRKPAVIFGKTSVKMMLPNSDALYTVYIFEKSKV